MRVIGKKLTVLNRFLIFIQRMIYLLFLKRNKQKGLIDDYHFSIRRDWANKPKQNSDYGITSIRRIHL
jgi:hypothetical protein